MRIISGNYKGKKLFAPKDKITRPLKDAVKESIFNILEHSNLIKYKLYNSNILDLFSGIGNFGLECVSRNSRHVTFFENYSPALNILKKNIQMLNCSNKIEIIENDIFALDKLDLNIKNYEFIFLDPPFKEHRIQTLLKIIKNKKILKKNGTLLIHRDIKILDKFPEEFKIVIVKNYGRSKIFFGKFD